MTLDPTRMLDLRDGRFGDTTPEDLQRAFQILGDRDHLVIHAHGGLVNQATALEAIPNLDTALAASASPLYILWNSGPMETLWRNLPEIGKELIFSRLTAHALRWALRRVPSTPAGLTLSEEAQARQLAAELADDEELVEEVEALARPVVGGLPRPTLLDRDVLEALRAPPSASGLVLPGGALLKVARLLLRVITAVIRRRQEEPAPRPLGATVAEEVLRLFYGDAVGAAIWSAMKNDTRDAFEDGPGRGGTALLAAMADWWRPGRRVTFVGHSTGAVLLCHLLRAGDALLPEGCTLDAVLLAPACTFTLLDRTLTDHGHRLEQVRVFGLSDAREGGYAEVPVVYPASLLYLVSGLLEGDPDTPLVGMERYWDAEHYPANRWPELQRVRAWIEARGHLTIWAPADRGFGARSEADTHSAVGHEGPTLDSVRELLAVSSWRPLHTALRSRRPCDVLERWRTAAHSHPIPRRAPTPQPGGQGFRAAAVQVDLTPELYRRTAGYGLFNAAVTEGWAGRCQATLILLEDDRGERALLVAIDLHAGSRYLAEALGHYLADLGLSVDRVMLCASHTHSEPGGFYGTPLYDRLAGQTVLSGFDVIGTQAFLDALVRAARTLPAALQPARIGHGKAVAWGPLWNRSVDAHLANGMEPRTDPQRRQAWLQAQAAEAHPDVALPDQGEAFLAVDAWVRVLRVGPDADDAPPWATVAFVSATPTLSPAHAAWATPDAFGAAARELGRRLHRRYGRSVPAQVVGGANGDVNVVPAGWPIPLLQQVRDERDPSGAVRPIGVRRRVALRLMRHAGRALANALEVAHDEAAGAMRRPERLDVRFAEPVAPEARGRLEPVDIPSHLTPPPDTEDWQLPCRWRVGQSTVAASELNRSWSEDRPPDHELERSDRTDGPLLQPVDWGDPHSPKEAAVKLNGFLPPLKQQWLTFLKPLGKLGLDPFLPLRILSIDDLHLIGLPVEASVGFDRQLREALRPALGDQLILGSLAGGYAGYASTVAEYVVHDYEGASNYWGRHLSTHLRQQLQALAASDPLAPGEGAEGEAWFVRNKEPLAPVEPDVTPPAAAGLTTGARIDLDTTALPASLGDESGVVRLAGSWTPSRKPKGPNRRRRGSPLPAGRFFVRLVDAETREPLEDRGVPLDDIHHEFGVWFDRKARQWRWICEVPEDAVRGREVTFEIADDPAIQPKDGFSCPGGVAC